MTVRFEGKTAIVTGGGGNIGRQTALRLASEGAAVAVCDLRLEPARQAADEIIAQGGRAVAIALDVQNSAAVEKAVEEAVGNFGKVDILVNAAGGSAREKSKNLCQQTDEVLVEIIGTNLMGAIYFARAAAVRMLKNHYGRIVNVASIVGMQGKAGFVEYSAAKGGVIAMTKSLAMELGPDGITVNCVSPGLVARDDHDDSRTNYLGRNCLAREVAGLIAYLASDEAAFITGQNYVIDGGRILGLKGDS